jgi:hypothetical protein
MILEYLLCYKEAFILGMTFGSVITLYFVGEGYGSR